MRNAKPQVSIKYCTGCKWLLRAAWLAQELLSTFENRLEKVELIPGEGGIFEIQVDREVIWNRKTDGGFPQAAELKRRVRDLCFPKEDLGHSDQAP